MRGMRIDTNQPVGVFRENVDAMQLGTSVAKRWDLVRLGRLVRLRVTEATLAAVSAVASLASGNDAGRAAQS